MTKTVVVIGAGITGLATAWGLLRRDPRTRVHVVDAAPRVGGNLRSDDVDGFVVDHGPNAFLAKGDATLRLVDGLGLTPELVPASAAAKYRYVFRGDRLVRVPTSPLAMATSPLVGPRGLRELIGEPFRPPRSAPDEEETVTAFLRRRLGPHLTRELAAPMVAGITGGDARTISIDALFPGVVAMEAESGSLIRGAIRAARARRGGPPRRPGSQSLTFASGGMGRLPSALADALGDRVQLGCAATRVERLGPDGVAASDAPGGTAGGTSRAKGARARGRAAAATRVEPMRGEAPTRWRVHFEGAPPIDAHDVVLAVPAFVAARLVRDVVPAALNDLNAVAYAGVRVLALGYRRADVPHAMQGFGYLVAPGTRHRSLGCLWTSSIFPHQAPAGHVALRVIAGGANDPGFVALDDEHALLAVQRDLRLAMGIQRAPVMVRHVVWPQAIPQYGVGHVARVARIESLLASDAPGLHLGANAWHGVAVNDCTARAEALVERIRSDRMGARPA